MNIQQQYAHTLAQWSDIRRHLPVLRKHARGNVLELGTRGGVSTVALLAGVEANGGHVWSVDVDDCGHLFDHPQWTFIRGDSRDVETIVFGYGVPDDLDLLFLDTLHDYHHVSDELEAWGHAVKPGGWILIHDTELSIGARRAVLDWTLENGIVTHFRRGSNGLGMIHIPNETEED